MFTLCIRVYYYVELIYDGALMIDFIVGIGETKFYDRKYKNTTDVLCVPSTVDFTRSTGVQ